MIWWIDAQAGASGDMLLGALLSLDPAGLPHAQRAVDEVIEALHAEPVRLGLEACRRGAMAATRATVSCADATRHRTWADIAPAVSGRAHAVFQHLAQAEADVHGVGVDSIHFHEVGALDAIADIVGVCALVDRLAPERVVVSDICVGSGTVGTEHGILTVPGPAVTELLRGIRTFAGPIRHEACTPTGAALLATLADEFGGQPPMTVTNVVVGAGGRETPGQPYILRILTGESGPPSALYAVETTIDDLDPRLYPSVISAVKAAGAVEAWLTPAVMKHGRPAVTLTALTSDVEAVARVLFTHTTTLGVRYHEVQRTVLDRDFITVDVEGHSIAIKRGWLDGEVVTEQPEYSDVRATAEALGLPEREVLRRVHKKGSDATDGGDSDVRTPKT